MALADSEVSSASATQPGGANARPVDGELSVELTWSPVRGELRQQAFSVSAGTTVAELLTRSGWFESDQIARLKVGVWGRVQSLDTALQAGDRVEVYRPLTVDPKEARRQRYKATGRRIVTRHRPLGRKA